MAASVVILTAGYILWTIQRVYLGPEYKGPHGEALTPMSRPRDRHRRAAGGAWPSSSASIRRRCSTTSTPSVQKTVTEMRAVGENVDHAAASKQ